MARSHPLSHRTIRVIGRRAFRESDPTDPNVNITFDDDGQMVAEESRDIAADDGAAILAVIERRRFDAEMLVDGLTPSAYALYLSLRDVLSRHQPAIETRLAGVPDHLLIALRVPDSSWYRKAASAFEAVVAGIVADRVRTPSKTASVIPEHDRLLGHRVLPIETALRHAKSSHVVALYSDDAHLPAELTPFCDVVLDMTRIVARHFDTAIEREYDEPDAAAWPAKIRMADVDADLFDAVCGRAPAASDVTRMLGAVLAARATAKAAAVKSEAAAEIEKNAKAAAKAVYTPAILRPTSPTLADLHGYGSAAAWGHQLAEDVRDYVAGMLQWADVDGGCLLHGPPGTGKTLFASALAATCGLPFIAASYAQWQTSGDGHLGYVVKAIRATFEAANAAAPCILFIDEADSLRFRGGSGDGDGWWTAIVNCVLECVDGSSRRHGVIIIAACNNPRLLDPALVRSGRLDRQFEIGLPDEQALLGIMKHHLPDAVAEELAPAATALAGSASGADISRIAREARRLARREKRPVTAADLLSIAIPPDSRSERDRRLVAIHEAGHAVAMMSQGRIPDMLSIVSDGNAHGGVRAESPAGMGRLADLEDDIVVRLAGRAAEEVVLGEPSAGAMGDLQQATDLATHIVGLWGLGGRLFYSDQVDAAAVGRRLRELHSRAIRLILGRAALAEFAAAHGLGGAR
jgi:hypothetical protein